VDAVVEGTIAGSAGRVRVTAQVIQADPENHVWAESYDRPIGDVIPLQRELAREIARAVRIKLTWSDQARFLGTL
jgi:adenylate cyclase